MTFSHAHSRTHTLTVFCFFYHSRDLFRTETHLILDICSHFLFTFWFHRCHFEMFLNSDDFLFNRIFCEVKLTFSLGSHSFNTVGPLSSSYENTVAVNDDDDENR